MYTHSLLSEGIDDGQVSHLVVAHLPRVVPVLGVGMELVRAYPRRVHVVLPQSRIVDGARLARAADIGLIASRRQLHRYRLVAKAQVHAHLAAQ